MDLLSTLNNTNTSFAIEISNIDKDEQVLVQIMNHRQCKLVFMFNVSYHRGYICLHGVWKSQLYNCTMTWILTQLYSKSCRLFLMRKPPKFWTLYQHLTTTKLHILLISVTLTMMKMFICKQLHPLYISLPFLLYFVTQEVDIEIKL